MTTFFRTFLSASKDVFSQATDGPDLYLWHLFLIVFAGSLFMYATTRFVCACSLSNHRRRGPLLRWHPPRTAETVEDARLRPWEGNLGVHALTRRGREPNVFMLLDSHDRDDEMCAICLDSTASGAVALPCGHHFHADCIWKWIRVSARCPLCSISVYTDDETPLPIDTANGADQDMESSGGRTLHMRRDFESTRVETGSADERSESTNFSTLSNTSARNSLDGSQNLQIRMRADSDSDRIGFTTFFVRAAGVDDSTSMMVVQDGIRSDESAAEPSYWVVMQGSDNSHSDMVPVDLPGHISAPAFHREDHHIGAQVAGARPTSAPVGVQDTSNISAGPAGRHHPQRVATVARDLHVGHVDDETDEIAPLTNWSRRTSRFENRSSTADLERGQESLVRSTSSEEIQQLLLRAQRLLDSIPRFESCIS